MYVCMYVCSYVCMYVCMYVQDLKFIYVFYVCMYECLEGDDPASRGSDGFQQPHLRPAHFHSPMRGWSALAYTYIHTYIHTHSIHTYIYSSGVRHHRPGSAEENLALAVLRKV